MRTAVTAVTQCLRFCKKKNMGVGKRALITWIPANEETLTVYVVVVIIITMDAAIFNRKFWCIV